MRIVIELPEGFKGETVQIRPAPELGSGEVLYVKVTRATEVSMGRHEFAPVAPDSDICDLCGRLQDGH